MVPINFNLSSCHLFSNGIDKFLHMRLKCYFFLAFSFLAVSCSETAVEPTSGGITGSVLPANGASKVYLIRDNDTIKADINADGTYEIMDVTAGKYKLSAKPRYGLTAPIPGPIIINGGFTTQAYPIRLPAMPVSGLFSVSLQDSIRNGSPVYNLFGEPGFSVSSGAYKFTFTFPKINGTGTLSTATKDLQVEVTFNQQIWKANSAEGNAVLNITYFDPVSKRGDGTFTFTAVKAGEIDIIGENGKLQFVKLRQ